jgi:flagellar biosynthesis chaperone FliJ
MIASYIDAIEKLRANRERSALIALRNSNKRRDNFAAAVTQADEFLRLQTAAHLARESQLYKQTLAAPLSPRGIEAVQARIQRESSAIDALAEQCGKLRQLAKEAASAAEMARGKHASLFRAQRKWEKIRDYYAEKFEIEEAHREEIVFDDISIRNHGR